MPVNNIPDPVSDPVLLDMASDMRDMITETRLDRNDRTDAREVAHRPRTIQERIGDAFTDRTLILCLAPHDDDMPPMNQERAELSCDVSERYTLQKGVYSAADLLDVPSFKVTPTQIMAFKSFR
jgi:hypothetical protein